MSIVIIVSLYKKHTNTQKKKKKKLKLKLKLSVLVLSSGCHTQSPPSERMP